MKNIGKKILAVMEAVESVEKDGFNSFHKYKYTSDAAIVTAIRKEIIKNKLVVIPNQTACVQNGSITTLTVTYTIIDTESGETVTGVSCGQGQDNGDKGVYKAATGAEKYFFLKTLLIPTDDDPENEKQAPAKPYTPAPKQAPATWEHPAESAPTSLSATIVIDKINVLMSKKGTPYLKVIDSNLKQYFVFDKKLIGQFDHMEGQEIVVSYKTDSYGDTILTMTPLMEQASNE